MSEESENLLKRLQDECYYPEQHKMYHSILQECPCAHGYGYEGMVDSWGYKVLVWDGDDDYQGDYVVFLQDGDQYGYVAISYGSCSGCDALQACYNWDEKRELCNSLRSSIVWKSKQEMLDWFEDRDWETKIEFIANKEVLQQFIEKAIQCMRT